MNKTELIRIANTYGMELTRNPITSEAWCFRLESNDYTPFPFILHHKKRIVNQKVKNIHF